jgi:transcription-repair coupling factor (superfamily II helicase)
VNDQTVKNLLLSEFLASDNFAEVLRKREESPQEIGISGCVGSSRAIVTTLVYQKLADKLILILPDHPSARQFYDELAEFIDEEKLLYLPPNGSQAWSEVGPLTAVVGRKISTLKHLLSRDAYMLVSSAAAISEKLAHPGAVRERKIQIVPGREMDFDEIIATLVNFGFVREERVDRPGEMSVRGGIIDIFPYEAIHPQRIEFFGDQIESIREFDVESQKSFRQISLLEIIPISAIGFYGPFDEHPINSLPLTHSIFDYLHDDTTILLYDHPFILNEIENFYSEMSARLELFSREHNFDDELKFGEYYLEKGAIEDYFCLFYKIKFQRTAASGGPVIDFNLKKNVHFAGNIKLFKKEVDNLFQDNLQQKTVAVLCDSEAQTVRMKDLLEQEDFSTNIKIETLNLAEGFFWEERGIAVYTDKEIFGKIRLPKLDKIEKRKISFKNLTEIRRGDFVVHTDYGIGKFKGLKTIDAYGKERECLELEYRDGDVLYVPLEKMDRIQKYSGRDTVVPSLSKLGTAQWEKIKSKTKSRVKEIATQLIKLYAKRKTQPGFQFSKDTVWQYELESSFIYDETVDQLRAVEEIKKDMESPIPMDRLVCGDVGYGKTEVAVRAAFKTINDEKQVALLVPTTVLAQQHYTTFKDRLQAFPLEVEVLSRFKTKPQQKEILERMAMGKIDLIIGTHRLLSNDVKFKDLGLLIVDEEQKFGVLHKERLKMLKETVDTLTLSATPIPRTMHMALIGARDMSIINTPPSNRIPIKTEVCRFDKELIREVILQEVNRGGQVFFVHNRVQSIHAIANALKEILPEVIFAVAHGQMKSRDLETVMLKFTNGEIQCLVSTMIIESGLDLPNANTLIINRADKFGLSQLYQLRGRVGRSSQQAYAYLLIPPMRKLTREAIKRLQTVQEYSHLGSGYKIAMRDLEIRGAGNIFGAQQSGFVDALGYELYTKIIEEAIDELRDELNMEKQAIGQDEKDAVIDTKLEFEEDAFLPKDYVTDPSERVDVYKRLIEAKSVERVQELEHELLDRFGPMPPQAQNLINYVSLKKMSATVFIDEIKIKKNKARCKFHKNHVPTGEQLRMWLGKKLQKASMPFELIQEKQDLFFEITLNAKENYIETMKKFLHSIM